MTKTRVGKFPKAFRQYAVTRLKQCDHNVEPSKELASIGGCCIPGAISSNRRKVARATAEFP